jgi:hypothetical protein
MLNDSRLVFKKLEDTAQIYVPTPRRAAAPTALRSQRILVQEREGKLGG